MFGFSRSGDSSPLYTTIMILTGLVAVYYGYTQSLADKESEREKLLDEMSKKAQREIADAVRYWLDRCNDKMTEYLREICHHQRTDFVMWYRETVIPSKSLMEEEAQIMATKIKEAQAQIRPLERKILDIEECLKQIKQITTVLNK